jgi:hypothetical protein
MFPSSVGHLAKLRQRDMEAEVARERLAAQARATRPAATQAESDGPRFSFTLTNVRYALTSLTAVALGLGTN